ncbi:MAG: divalent-cation tolerance protein CutA [Hormoscilla sp. GUM202]|nr:divalent-cation tolerance protein CutA [Hormoscilla sp. GUM202]
MNRQGFEFHKLPPPGRAGSSSEAEAIASSLVEAKLAACVSITPIKSIYSWEGKIESQEEWQLTIKTDLGQFATLEAQVLQLHSYEVPEIIALPLVTGSKPYLEWIVSVGGRVGK